MIAFEVELLALEIGNDAELQVELSSWVERVRA